MSRTYLGLMPPLALITRCHGTLPLWKVELFLVGSVDGEGRCFRHTPTCLENRTRQMYCSFAAFGYG